MTILSIRTDKPEAEIGLYEDENELSYKKWNADRQLSENLYMEIKKLLEANKKEFKDLGGIVCFKGPGSFTGLRIGVSAANALAYGLNINIVGEVGEDWIKKAITTIESGKHTEPVMPEYGAEPHITKPKH